MDVSDPENAEWRVPVGGASFFYAVPTGTDDFSIMAMGDIPETPVEMAMFLELEYMDKIVHPVSGWRRVDTVYYPRYVLLRKRLFLSQSR